jgi:hypothetical protein
MHGFSLNCKEKMLPWFKHINPCGFADKGVTSLESELSKNNNTHLDIDMEETTKRVIEIFGRTFESEMVDYRDKKVDVYDKLFKSYFFIYSATASSSFTVTSASAGTRISSSSTLTSSGSKIFCSAASDASGPGSTLSSIIVTRSSSVS